MEEKYVYVLSHYDCDYDRWIEGVFDSLEKCKEACGKFIEKWFSDYTDENDKNDYRINEDAYGGYQIIHSQTNYLEIGLDIDKFILNDEPFLTD